MTKIARGFTLVELMVVIVIFAILVGLAMMNFGRFTPGMRFRDAQERTLGVLRTGRLRAITKETTARVFLYHTGPGILDSFRIIVMDPRTKLNPIPAWAREGGGTLPRDVDFTAPGDTARFEFHADGSVRLSYPTNTPPRLVSTSRAAFNGTLQVIPASGTATMTFP